MLELTDEQIEHFLTTWCPAVERHMARSAEPSRRLTAQQEAQSDLMGKKQRDQLLTALKTNVGIRRLAANPLMLTILALIQRSGKTLPHRRIDLYQVVTRTLLDNWNQGSGRNRVDVALAEQTLAHLAYHQHRGSSLLTEQTVKEIVRDSMQAFYEGTVPDEEKVAHFITTIRAKLPLDFAHLRWW